MANWVEAESGTFINLDLATCVYVQHDEYFHAMACFEADDDKCYIIKTFKTGYSAKEFIQNILGKNEK